MSILALNKLKAVLVVFLVMEVFISSAVAIDLGGLGSSMYYSNQAAQQQQKMDMQEQQIKAQELQNQQQQQVLNCISACGRDGNCQSSCIAAGNGQTTMQKRIDFQCVNDCTSRGYMLQLCQNRCSY